MKKISLLFLVLFLTINTYCQVLSAPLKTHQETNWYWAATTECVLEYYGYPTPECVIAEYTRTSSFYLLVFQNSRIIKFTLY